MRSIPLYIFSLIIASIICGILSALTDKSFARKQIRMICGFALVITVFIPRSYADFKDIFYSSFPAIDDAYVLADTGEEKAREAAADIIIQKSEAYILDKAALLNADISVSITLDSDNLPHMANISGDVMPAVQRELERIFEYDLGITKENLLWTG